MTIQPVPVWVKALDPLSQFGLDHALRRRPEVALVTDAELAALPARPTGPPPVAMIAVDALDAAAVQVLRSATQRGCRRIALIGSTIDDDALLAAVELRVAGVLRRTEATPDRIVHLVLAAASAAGSLPPDLLGRLLGQTSRRPRQLRVARGGGLNALSDRETQVLRLVADGKDTQEIARELSYSERTVKNVLHDVTSRLQLRNRSHAVAYALREGLI
ncbi:response regulator transcription factor [Kribbella sp. HUAS MG21]|uniref:Response regulator transcription factor n=1 Tax=Kribbella sp. HUAS MG21 TaxID=3160966 RepID=A0AAU7T6X7_9ACTN